MSEETIGGLPLQDFLDDLHQTSEIINNYKAVIKTESVGNKERTLYATLRGGYLVYKNNECIHEGMQIYNALEKYHSINLEAK